MTYTAEQIAQIERQNRARQRQTRNLCEAFAVREAANDLYNALSHSDGIYSTRANHRLLDLCNAIIGLMDDGDALACRDNVMTELGCDEYGNPVDEDGDLVRYPTDARTLANRSVAA